MFYNAEEFPFFSHLEQEWEKVRFELMNLSKTYFTAWPEKNLYNGEWNLFHLFALGRKIEENCEYCPKTAKILSNIPGLVNAAFSSLAPGAHATPHRGYTNRVLRYHLGLITPDNCALRVGTETRGWSAGSSFVFDDTIEHEAWNRGDSTRIILLIDFKKNLDEELDFPERLLEYKIVSDEILKKKNLTTQEL